MKIPFFTELENAKTVLIAGMGGGYDVFTGLPLYAWLRDSGKTVYLASLSSGALGFCDAEMPIPGLWRITADTAASKYFPEMHLSRWLTDRFGYTEVYAIELTGARTLCAAYRWLAETLCPDAIVLVDGGTDGMMQGNEVGLGTPEADIASLLAITELEGIKQKLVVCLGFGVDSHHGVCHAHFLQNVASLIVTMAFLEHGV